MSRTLESAGFWRHPGKAATLVEKQVCLVDSLVNSLVDILADSLLPCKASSVITAERSDLPQDLLWRSQEAQNRHLRSKLCLESVCEPLGRSYVAARYGGAAR